MSEEKKFCPNPCKEIELGQMTMNRLRMSRKTWDAYFMDIAAQVATRATCDRKSIGAVVVRNRNILVTGYNGSLPGQPHCDQVGHLMENDHCVRTVHAEANAIAQAAKNGISIAGATLYTTASPCWPCFKLVASAGIACIVFGELYRDERIKQFAAENGIVLVDFSKVFKVEGCEEFHATCMKASAQQLPLSFLSEMDALRTGRFSSVHGNLSNLPKCIHGKWGPCPDCQGEKREFVIVSDSERGYWSNSVGWAHNVAFAARFTNPAAFNLPVTAKNDARWVGYSPDLPTFTE